MAQFKLFSKLPAELRVTIWDAAIRDNSPAAHFFTTYHDAFDPNFTVDPESRVSDTPNTPDTPGRYRHIYEFSPARTYRFRLAAPHNCPDSEYSWVDRNPSAYMTDSGLWTACWESRQRMMRHFQPNQAISQYTEPVDSQDGKPVNAPATFLSDAPVTLPFRRDNGERQQLTIRPSEDLICLQFAKGPAQYWCLRRNLPTFRRPRPGGAGWEVTATRHVAVEFDPVLLEPRMAIAYPFGRDCYGDAVFKLAGVWFITRTLERRYKTDEDRSRRRTFRAAGGMELVEVRRGDDEWWDRSWELDASDSRCTYRSRAEDLAEELHRTVLTDKTDESIDDSADERLPARRFGVLACVRPGSEKHLPTKSEWMGGCSQQVDFAGEETRDL